MTLDEEFMAAMRGQMAEKDAEIATLKSRLAAVEAERDECAEPWRSDHHPNCDPGLCVIRARCVNASLTARLAAVEAERDEARRADDQRTGEWNRALQRAERAEAERDEAIDGECQRAEERDRARAALARAMEALRELHHSEICGGICQCDAALREMLEDKP